MARTNPFASIMAAAPEVPEEPTEAVPKLLAHKPSRAKRNREWEAQQARVTVTYRGIPPELNARLKLVAEELEVPVGDVVRAFLERGLAAYEQGDLLLQPRLRIGRKTLYPGER